MAQQLPKHLSWRSYLILVVTLLAGLWIYQSIWGFGGFYTHINHIPTPGNLTRDSYTTPFSIDSRDKYFRDYDTELIVDELIVFHQQALPKMGWVILKEDWVTLVNGKPVYCVIASQRNITAYIAIAQGTSQSNDIGSSTDINLYNSMSVPWCAEDQF